MRALLTRAPGSGSAHPSPRSRLRQARPDAGPVAAEGPACSVVVPSASDGAPHSAEQHQDQSDDQDDDAERPQNRDAQQETEDQQDESNNDHEVLLPQDDGDLKPVFPKEARSMPSPPTNRFETYNFRVKWEGRYVAAVTTVTGFARHAPSTPG